MKRPVWIALVFLLMATICNASPSHIQHELSKLIDQTPGLQEHDIEIDVRHNGIVRLSGEVSSYQDKRKIIELAHSIRGVEGIDDVLIISPRASEKKLADVALAESVLEQIQSGEPQLHNYQVRVIVKNRVARLQGSVESEEGRRLAKRLAMQTPGIVDVIDELGVRDPVPDTIITQHVREALASDPEIQVDHVDISTKNGVVLFRGAQADHRAVDRILSKAFMVEGVNDVRNEMTIAGKEYPREFR